MILSIVVVVALAAAPHTPLAAVLPHGGKPKNKFQGNETRTVCGVVTGVAGNDGIALRIDDGPNTTNFPAYYHLRQGKVWPGVKEPEGYRLQDVKEGDHVMLTIFKEDRRAFCVDINIYKRPGGRVPPSWVEHPDYKKVFKQRYHEWMNETNDEKDFGIPKPKRK